MKTIVKKILLISAVVLPGCTAQKETTLEDIAGQWNIETACGQSTAEGENQAFINFGENGEMTGNTSVNSFFGQYTLKDGKLVLENIGMTRKMGPNMEIETAVTEALNAIATIEVKDSTASVLNEEGKVIMTLKK
ncbi:MAG: META domain-containing protein [Bacteroidaceae bacterium]|nr:META domain-containing protein [Bacteroidaceae bacterium]MBR2945496.1 META domain-containing protein [Bacteroidaceae bacterium]MDO5489359.1 META domain-containing protein [Bacteroidaceae bacterium]